MAKKGKDKNSNLNTLREFADMIREVYGDDTEKMKQDILKMMNKQVKPDKISEAEWTFSNPKHLKSSTDKFYTKLVNKILEKFATIIMPPDFPEGVLEWSAMGMVAYLQDIISETKIWSTVRALYKSRYSAVMPFFEVDPEDYFDDDINIQDLKVIIWQAFNRIGKNDGRIFSPLSEAVDSMSKFGFDILVENFEKAPSNTRALTAIEKSFKSGDFFELREIGLWLSADCPLTAEPFLRTQMKEDSEHTLNLEGLPSTLFDSGTAYYFEESKYGWKKRMSLMGCGANEFLAQMAKEYGYDAIAEKLMTVKAIPYDCYDIVSADEKTITFRNILSKEFRVDKDSLRSPSLLRDKKGALAALVRFGDVYYQNGVLSLSDNPMIKAEKNEAVEFPEEKLEEIRRVVKNNKGRRSYYLKSADDVNKILDTDIRPMAMPIDGNGDTEMIEIDNLLMLLSDTEAPILIDGACRFFKDKANPYYEKDEDSDSECLSFIVNTCLPDDVISYIVKNKLLADASMYASQGKRVGKRLVQDNLDFLLHFYRV